MRPYKALQYIGCAACFIGGVTGHVFLSVIGFVVVVFAVVIQSNELERRLDALEGDEDETK